MYVRSCFKLHAYDVVYIYILKQMNQLEPINAVNAI